jgi:hypothetical protein
MYNDPVKLPLDLNIWPDQHGAQTGPGPRKAEAVL